MPTYQLENQKTGEVKDIFCSYEDKKKIQEEHGVDWKWLIGAPSFTTVVSGSREKACGKEWHNVLEKIHKEAGPKSTVMNNPYEGNTAKSSRKTTKKS